MLNVIPPHLVTLHVLPCVISSGSLGDRIVFVRFILRLEIRLEISPRSNLKISTNGTPDERLTKS